VKEKWHQQKANETASAAIIETRASLWRSGDSKRMRRERLTFY